jgi:hypothetical protein
MQFTNGHNPKDPMNNIGPSKEHELFEAFGRVADGHDVATVISVALNTYVNAIRSAYATRGQAERAFDEHLGRAKNLLLEQHYDPVTSKRRNIFPHTQVVHAELVHWDPKKNKGGT